MQDPSDLIDIGDVYAAFLQNLQYGNPEGDSRYGVLLGGKCDMSRLAQVGASFIRDRMQASSPLRDFLDSALPSEPKEKT